MCARPTDFQFLCEPVVSAQFQRLESKPPQFYFRMPLMNAALLIVDENRCPGATTATLWVP
jgi:hypothetical protein